MDPLHREIIERADTISRKQSRQILQLILDAQLEDSTERTRKDTYVHLTKLTPQVLQEILRIVST